MYFFLSRTALAISNYLPAWQARFLLIVITCKLLANNDNFFGRGAASPRPQYFHLLSYPASGKWLLRQP